MKRVTRRALLAGMAFGVACGPNNPDEVVCDRQPPYRLAVTCAEGALPPSTEVHIEHGGGEVDYRLYDPPAESDLVFCSPEPADGQEVESLSCDLWTQGAVTITVTAHGYEPLEEEVALEKENGCVVTQSVTMVLVKPVE